MKPPVENIRVSSKGRDILILAKRHTGLKQWNEHLRWAFCISLANPDPPKLTRKLDQGIEPIEWQTFAGECGNVFTAAFKFRARKDAIPIDDEEAVVNYFRAHIERGIAALRSIRSLEFLVSHALKQPPGQEL